MNHKDSHVTYCHFGDVNLYTNGHKGRLCLFGDDGIISAHLNGCAIISLEEYQSLTDQNLSEMIDKALLKAKELDNE